MEKSRRDVESNKRINIISVCILITLIILFTFILIYLLYSSSRLDRKIETLKGETTSISLENNSLLLEIKNIQEQIDGVINPASYIEAKQENYKTLLPQIEKITKSSSTIRVAFLSIAVDYSPSLQEIINIINDHDVLATYFINNVNDAENLYRQGNVFGVYLEDEDKANDFVNNYGEITEKYSTDLFMLSGEIKDKEIEIPGYYRVKENSTSEGIRLLTQQAYADNIIDTTADRDFLIIKVNSSSRVGINSLSRIIEELKSKNYTFLPLVSSSTIINNNN